ncbi:hypothetical protein H6P81_011306 [Aristolochia fimbriata]|uniref:Uncharacterized protein n=1 Tax=Aristolochia fimbriata TaxID=158543 RepID=A0AAV7ES90_ARIFI|nr:hypothetical protein H6P81_011306 [Aristolochia fimbriata]
MRICDEAQKLLLHISYGRSTICDEAQKLILHISYRRSTKSLTSAAKSNICGATLRFHVTSHFRDMERTTLHLLVVVLALSHFISLEAAPFARIRRLSEGSLDLLVSINTNQITLAEGTSEELLTEGRMDLETNDYKPGNKGFQ